MAYREWKQKENERERDRDGESKQEFQRLAKRARDLGEQIFPVRSPEFDGLISVAAYRRLSVVRD